MECGLSCEACNKCIIFIIAIRFIYCNMLIIRIQFIIAIRIIRIRFIIAIRIICIQFIYL